MYFWETGDPVSFTGFDGKPIALNRYYHVLLFESALNRFKEYNRYLLNFDDTMGMRCYILDDFDRCPEEVAMYYQNIILNKTCSCEHSVLNDDHIFVVKSRDIKNFISETSDSETCTVMLLDNQVGPQWIDIDCNATIASSFFCFTQKKPNNLSYAHAVASFLFCPRNQLVINDTCYLLMRQKQRIAKQMKQVHSFIEHLVLHIVKCVAEPFPQFFVLNNTHFMTIKLCSNINKFKLQKANPQDSAAILISTSLISAVLGGNALFCDKVQAMSILNLCDGKVDCLTKEKIDESMCTCNRATNYSKHCKYLSGGSLVLNCSDFYVKIKNTCHFYPLKNNHNNTFQIKQESCAKSTQAMSSIQMSMFHVECVRLGKFSCKKSTTCFTFRDICTFKLDRCGKVIPCNFGSHIENCEDFNCSTTYKCPKYYCIPWVYVCNGRWDCPFGSEELKCEHKNHCCNLFSCQGSNLCIHPVDVCDGTSDCPHEDDEYFCIQNVKCPSGCHCLFLVVRCFSTNMTPSMLIICAKFEVIVFIKSPFLNNTLGHSIKSTAAVQITISRSGLDNICTLISHSTNLIFIESTDNAMWKIQTKCFVQLKHLRVIKMSSNNISQIEKRAFAGLQELLFVDLSENPLHVLEEDAFNSLSKIFCLVLGKKRQLQEIPYNVFSTVEIILLQTNSFLLCCTVPPTTFCSAEPAWFESCQRLLATEALRVTFSTVLSLSLTVNLYSVIFQYILNKVCPEKFKSYRITVSFIHFGEILFAASMTVLLAADQIYGNKLELYQNKWKSSSVCFTVLSLFLLNNLASPYLLGFFALMRFMVVYKPMNSKFKSGAFVAKCLVVFVFLFVLVSSGMSTLLWGVEGKIPSSLCSPFIDPTDASVITFIYTWLFAIYHSVAIGFIIVCYCNLIVSLQRSQKVMKEAVSRKTSNQSLIIQISILVTVNFFSWIPQNIIFLVSLFLKQYPADMLKWTLVLTFFLNPILHPIVFVVNNIRKMKEKSNN